jgi:hypothetical protein
MDIQINNLSSSDDLVLILDKIRRSAESKILFVLPIRSSLLLRKLDMVLLARTAQNQGKMVALVTRQAFRESLARSLGIPVFSSIKEARLAHWPPFEPVSIRRPEYNFSPENITGLFPNESPPRVRFAVKILAASVLILILALMAAAVVLRATIYYDPTLHQETLKINATASLSNTIVSAAGQLPLHRKVLTVTLQGDGPITGLGEKTELSGVSQSDIDTLKMELINEFLENAEVRLEEALSESDIVVPGSIQTDRVVVLGAAKGIGNLEDRLFMVITINIIFDTLKAGEIEALGRQALALNHLSDAHILPQDFSYALLRWETNGSNSHDIEIEFSQSYYSLIDPEAAFFRLRGVPTKDVGIVLEDTAPDLTFVDVQISPGWFPWMPFFSYQVSFITTGADNK